MRQPLHAAGVATALLGAVYGQSYDYIIVGGGTAGLAVAARLAQSRNYSVAVLEAGGTGAGNLGISIPGMAGSTFGTEIDWAYTIEPQKYAANVTEIYPRGKVLGGSSAINLMLNCKASAADYNTIESLGNEGWGYARFSAAMKKVEKLIVPPANYSYVRSDHGAAGPVDSTFPISPPEQFDAYIPAAKALGHPISSDAFSGNSTGAWIYPSAINTTEVSPTRVTSNTAYYSPNAFLPNLHVFTNAYVTTLQTETTHAGVRVAGVQWVPTNATYLAPRNLTANKEVVLSAGSVETPAILERSGIGSKELLDSLGIETVLDLPAVGNNFADHPCILGTYKLKPGYTSMDNVTDNISFLAEALGDYAAGTGILTGCAGVLDYEPMANLFNASDIAEGYALLNGTPSYLTQQEYETVVNSIKTGNAVEYLMLNAFFENDEPADPDQAYITMAICLQHPLSRGSIHINSSDPTVAPKIDPNYYVHPFDLWLASKAAQYGRKFMSQAAWANIIEEEQYPGPSVQTDAEWIEAVQRRVRTEYHPIGTASMKPHSSGGVVNNQLLVYNTTNLRVVDASIIPIHLATHIALTVYSVAEIAADIMLS